jgi:hypothetical protein
MRRVHACQWVANFGSSMLAVATVPVDHAVCEKSCVAHISCQCSQAGRLPGTRTRESDGVPGAITAGRASWRRPARSPPHVRRFDGASAKRGWLRVAALQPRAALRGPGNIGLAATLLMSARNRRSMRMPVHAPPTAVIVAELDHAIGRAEVRAAVLRRYRSAEHRTALRVLNRSLERMRDYRRALLRKRKPGTLLN